MLLLASQALASSYYFLDSFPRGFGRGGANVAGADDTSAQYYNPAALINIERSRLQLNVWTVGQSVSFDRADESGINNSGDEYLYQYPEVKNEAPWIIEPTLAWAAPLHGVSPILKNTVLAVGFYLPSSPNLSYPETGAQRYSLINAQIVQAYIGPSVAQRITPWLTLGAGLQYTVLGVDQKINALAVIEGTYNEAYNDTQGSGDVTIELSTFDPIQISGNFGILLQPTPWLDVAASFQPAIPYEAKGSITQTFNPNHLFLNELAGDSFGDDDITLLVTLPMTLRAAVQVHPSEASRIELTGTWTHWSAIQELRVTDVELVIEHAEDSFLLPVDLTVTDDIVLKTGFQDSFSARLGGDVDVSDLLTLRAGLHYESSAIPDEYQGQNVVDGNKAGGGVGATFHVGKRFAFDVGFADTYIFPREITTSELPSVVVEAEVVDPYATYILDGKPVGNGTQKSNVIFAGVGATVFLGPGKQ